MVYCSRGRSSGDWISLLQVVPFSTLLSVSVGRLRSRETNSLIICFIVFDRRFPKFRALLVQERLRRVPIKVR